MLICKTGHQPLVFQCIVKPSKATDHLSTQQRKRHADQMQNIRKVEAGKGTRAVGEQQATELKLPNHQSHIHACAKAGIQQQTLGSRGAIFSHENYCELDLQASA